MKFFFAWFLCLGTYSTYISTAWDWGVYARVWALTTPIWQVMCLIYCILFFKTLTSLLTLMPLVMDFGFFECSLSSHLFEKRKSDFRVLTWNTESLNFYESKNKEKYLSKKALDWLIEHPADIKFMQEFIDMPKNPDYHTQRRFSQAGQDMLFLSQFDDIEKNKHGIAIATRGRIIEGGKVPDSTNILNNKALWADIVLKDDTLRAICAHLEPMSFTDRTFEPANWQYALKRYVSFSKTRTLQTQALLAFIRKSPYPVVLGGDFNDPPYSHNHYLLNQHLQDSFHASTGLGFSLKKKPHVVRIDRIYSSRHFRATKSRILKNIPISDHFPIESFYTKK